MNSAKMWNLTKSTEKWKKIEKNKKKKPPFRNNMKDFWIERHERGGPTNKLNNVYSDRLQVDETFTREKRKLSLISKYSNTNSKQKITDYGGRIMKYWEIYK